MYLLKFKTKNCAGYSNLIRTQPPSLSDSRWQDLPEVQAMATVHQLQPQKWMMLADPQVPPILLIQLQTLAMRTKEPSRCPDTTVSGEGRKNHLSELVYFFVEQTRRCASARMWLCGLCKFLKHGSTGQHVSINALVGFYAPVVFWFMFQCKSLLGMT